MTSAGRSSLSHSRTSGGRCAFATRSSGPVKGHEIFAAIHAPSCFSHSPIGGCVERALIFWEVRLRSGAHWPRNPWPRSWTWVKAGAVTSVQEMDYTDDHMKSTREPSFLRKVVVAGLWLSTGCVSATDSIGGEGGACGDQMDLQEVQHQTGITQDEVEAADLDGDGSISDGECAARCVEHYPRVVEMIRCSITPPANPGDLSLLNCDYWQVPYCE